MKLTAADKELILTIWRTTKKKYGLKTALAKTFGVRREYVHRLLGERMSHTDVIKRNKEIRARAIGQRWGMGKRLAREYGLSVDYVNKIIAGTR